jgi:hypothetical protein
METLLLSTTIRTNLPTQILEMGKRQGKEFLRWAFDILILSAVMIAVLLWRDEKERSNMRRGGRRCGGWLD